MHRLQRAIYRGHIAHDHGRRSDEMKAISGGHTLLTNIVITWNTSRIQQVVERWRSRGQKVDEAWLRRVGPVGFSHINFSGKFNFSVGRYAEALVAQSSDSARRASN
jgi:Tn3 transposase DDE domain